MSSNSINYSNSKNYSRNYTNSKNSKNLNISTGYKPKNSKPNNIDHLAYDSKSLAQYNKRNMREFGKFSDVCGKAAAGSGKGSVLPKPVPTKAHNEIENSNSISKKTKTRQSFDNLVQSEAFNGDLNYNATTKKIQNGLKRKIKAVVMSKFDKIFENSEICDYDTLLCIVEEFTSSKLQKSVDLVFYDKLARTRSVAEDDALIKQFKAIHRAIDDSKIIIENDDCSGANSMVSSISMASELAVPKEQTIADDEDLKVVIDNDLMEKPLNEISVCTSTPEKSKNNDQFRLKKRSLISSGSAPSFEEKN